MTGKEGKQTENKGVQPVDIVFHSQGFEYLNDLFRLSRNPSYWTEGQNAEHFPIDLAQYES